MFKIIIIIINNIDTGTYLAIPSLWWLSVLQCSNSTFTRLLRGSSSIPGRTHNVSLVQVWRLHCPEMCHRLWNTADVRTLLCLAVFASKPCQSSDWPHPSPRHQQDSHCITGAGLEIALSWDVPPSMKHRWCLNICDTNDKVVSRSRGHGTPRWFSAIKGY